MGSDGLRVALIAVGERGAEPWPDVAGRPLLLRQFDFARACGVERVIAYGNGSPEHAAALKQAVERAKIAHAAVASAHALVALVEWADELIVLQPGLVPEAGAAIEAVREGGREGGRVLSFSASTAHGASFERIDAANLWAGALVLPGVLVDRLEQLGEDADPHAALLRIALQSHLPLKQLPLALLADGSWSRVRPGGDEAALATTRVRRLATFNVDKQPSRLLAEWLGARFSLPLTGRRFVVSAGVTLTLALLAGALAAAWFGYPALAFLAAALAVPVLHLSRLVERVRRAAFQRPRLPRWFGLLPDATMFAASILTIDGAWYRQIFPPLVLLVALHTMAGGGRWRAIITDRALGLLLLSAAALPGATEPVLMAWALLILASGAAPPGTATLRR